MLRLLILLSTLVTPAFAQSACENGAIPSKLGFSPWPPDLTIAAIERGYDFIAKNGTIIAHHLDNGIPWDAALNGTNYPQHLLDDWDYRLSQTQADMDIFLSISPMSDDRSSLAPYWGDGGGNLPLPANWQGRTFDDPDVIAAFTNYALAAVERFQPEYMAIGIESNNLISNAPERWPAYLRLNAAVYGAVKAKHPNLPVFSTVQYEHLRGIEDDSMANAALQIPAVTELMRHSDMLVLSTYRYGFLHPNPPTPEYFDIAQSFGKPIAIGESGAMSKTIFLGAMPLPASKSSQLEFVDMILQNAETLNFAFVINWVNIDFDGTLNALPKEVRAFAKPWVYTGLETFAGKPKPALAIWRKCLGN